MKRGIILASLLCTSLVACKPRQEESNNYDPSLDGPIAAMDAHVADPLLEGRPAGAASEAPAPRPATQGAATTTAPAEGGDAETAKKEIDARFDQLKQMFADAKYEEFEQGGKSPEDWKAQLATDPQAMQKEVDKDKADPASAQKSFDEILALVKANKPVISADGTLAAYHFPAGSSIPAFAIKKVDGVWYPSESETLKIIGTPPAP